MAKILPQGLDTARFDAAVGELRAAVGAEWVYTDDERDLVAYRDAYAPVPAEQHAPSAAVAPKSVEEIQKILAVARAHNLPLWTISTGRNFAYGGPAPRKAGYIVLDLKRMNRIVEVNTKYGYAVVEPGVSYFDLYRHLQANGIKLWIDPAAPGWGGVLGNLVDHGAGYTPYGDHLLMQCGMQVVLADGTVVETGMGALPGAKTRELYKYGAGPSIDGLFTQGNFGIVTRVGIWLMPEPPGYRPYLVTFDNEEDLQQIIEIVQPLRLNMVIPNAATTVGLIWDAAISVTRRQYYTGEGPIPPSVQKKIMADLKIGMWNFYGALYGPPPIMDNNWKILEAAFSQVKGARFYFEGDRNDPTWKYRVDLMRGVPNMTEFAVLNWVGSGAHVDFSPVSPVSGADALRQYHIIRDRCYEYGFDYCGEFLVAWRQMLHIAFVMFDRNDEAWKRRAFELFEHLVADAAAAGYGEYRTHLDFMDSIASTYHWNDRALYRLHERIKDAIDPQGILSPGKMGIWPRHLRGG
jgi:4-cresol dehydrogenase (hydroxylating)